MAIKISNWKKWKAKLKNVYRFQIVDEKSYDVKMVLELNRLNILIGTGLILAIFTFINFIFIAFTPLKQYIPGYGSSSSRKEVIQLNMKTEELESMVSAQQEYITNIKNILEDNITVDTAKVKLKKAKIDTGILNVKTTDEKKFVQELEKGLKNAELMELVHDSKGSALSNLKLIKPVSGEEIVKFSTNSTAVHYLARPNEAVHAVLSGNVIFSGFSAENGNYLIVQAENQLVYILKNNNQLLKKTGNFVTEGEVVAKAGKTAEAKNNFISLELWYRGQPIDPQKFIKK